MKTEQFYKSPEVEIIEILNEGVMCLSGETLEYDYDEFEW